MKGYVFNTLILTINGSQEAIKNTNKSNPIKQVSKTEKTLYTPNSID